MLEMTEVSLDIAVATLINGTKNSKLITSLLTKPHEDVEDHIKKYMNAEEALALKYPERKQEKKIEKEKRRRKLDKAP